MKYNILVAVLLVSLLVFAGCTSGNSTTTAPQNTQTDNSPIKLGLLLPLTGEAASFGESGLAGATLAVKEINENGGIRGRELQLVAEDDKCSAEGVNAIQKLINVDKVVAIVGPVCSGSGGPALPIAQQNGIPVVITSASAPHLTKIGDYIFRDYPSDSFQGKAAADFLYNNLGKKKVAVVYVQNDWGQGIKEVFISRFMELGGEIVYQTGAATTEKDFKTIITKVKESGADVLYIPLYPASGVAMVKQVKEMNLNIPIFGGDSFSGEEFIASGVTDDVMYMVGKVENPENFKVKLKTLQGYENLDANFIAPLTYDGVKIMAEAMRKAGTDKAAIKEALKTTSYQGVSSELIEFDENGDLKKVNFEVKVVKNSKEVPF